MTGKEVGQWADEYMFTSEKHNASEGPKVHLLHMNADPLAQIAACAKMYKGEVVRSLSDVTHEERVEYLKEMQKTKLKMPLEAVTMHFMFENVTRAFTHQLVRQRTAAYAQESMRFAVVEDMSEAVALPPSLVGTLSWDEWIAAEAPSQFADLDDYTERYASKEQKMRFIWDRNVAQVGTDYMELVNMGMPAEDARGLMPTNIITRVNYITNLRGLLDHAGNRLCTQAQFEWRMVFAQIAHAIRGYKPHGSLIKSSFGEVKDGKAYEQALLEMYDGADAWQFEAIADLLKPVCYQTGSCAFKADFDRKCSIRLRVDENAKIGRPSSEWHEDYGTRGFAGSTQVEHKVHEDQKSSTTTFIGAIHTREWLTDPTAAR